MKLSGMNKLSRKFKAKMLTHTNFQRMDMVILSMEEMESLLTLIQTKEAQVNKVDLFEWR